MIDYLSTDSLPDIVTKNKQNIGILFGEFASGGISYSDLVKQVNKNATDAAKAVADAGAALQASADNKSLIDTNTAAIAANTAAIARILNDGIGGYLGTFGAADANDFTVLPQSAQDKERAMTEFPEPNGEIWYQEWKWSNGGWAKLGSKTDSHLHSQSGGITLAEVATQQDPKIIKFSNGVLTAVYEQVLLCGHADDEAARTIPEWGSSSVPNDYIVIDFEGRSVKCSSLLPTNTRLRLNFIEVISHDIINGKMLKIDEKGICIFDNSNVAGRIDWIRVYRRKEVS